MGKQKNNGLSPTLKKHIRSSHTTPNSTTSHVMVIDLQTPPGSNNQTVMNTSEKKQKITPFHMSPRGKLGVDIIDLGTPEEKSDNTFKTPNQKPHIVSSIISPPSTT